MEQLFRQTDLEVAHPAQHERAGRRAGARGDEPARRRCRPSSITAAKCWSGAPTIRLEKIADAAGGARRLSRRLLNLDKVIKIIRTEDEPKPKLMKAFGLTDNQAEAILNMRLRSLRKLEEMEIRAEHDALTKEQKDLKKLLGSDKLKSEKLIDEIKAIDAKFGLKTELGKRRTEIAEAKRRRRRSRRWPKKSATHGNGGRARTASPSSARKRAGCAPSRAIRSRATPIKYREGDRDRFWIHAETTDKLMMLATDGRFFTLDCAKLPGGRGNGEAIRTFIDLPPEADLVAMFVHEPGRKLLLAATTGPRLHHQRRRRRRHDQAPASG